MKTLDELSVTREGDEVRLFVRARSFLHHQVRNFAGTLKLVGEGKWSAGDLRRALEARDRAAGARQPRRKACISFQYAIRSPTPDVLADPCTRHCL